jgi:hypothetical protein
MKLSEDYLVFHIHIRRVVFVAIHVTSSFLAANPVYFMAFIAYRFLSQRITCLI